MFEFILLWYRDTYFWVKNMYNQYDLVYDDDDYNDNTIALIDYEFYQTYFFI